MMDFWPFQMDKTSDLAKLGWNVNFSKKLQVISTEKFKCGWKLVQTILTFLKKTTIEKLFLQKCFKPVIDGLLDVAAEE